MPEEMPKEIDVSTFLLCVEAILADEALRQRIVAQVCEETGLTPDKVAIFMTTLRDVLASRFRSNN